MKFLFKNCYMPFKNEIQDIYIKDGYIEKIYSNIENITVDKIINVDKRIVINGFVDSHMHLDKALIGEKASNQSGTLNEAIEIMTNYKENMSEADIKNRAIKTLELSYKNGTRYLRTHVDVDEIIELKGIRAILELKEEFKEKIDIQVVAFPQEGFIENINNYKYLEDALKLGADIVGGIPAVEKQPKEHIDMIFELAKKYNKDIDMHIDETDDPDKLTVKYLAEKTIYENYQGRVVAGHCCSLSANKLKDIKNILSLIKKAKIGIVTLPSTNLYLQGRNDDKNYRRGITRVKDLLEKGIDVSIGSDNIRDPFNPFGNGNLLEEALIAAHGSHMGGIDDLSNIFDMISVIPSSLFNNNYEFKEKQRARFIVIDTNKKHKAIIERSNIWGHFKKEEFKWNY
ncbi:amidohydrolase family protein [Senegalia massiliensis]|uniref:N-acyl-D-amino-acid deacylase n=1 Tax=Senegalia massiliensis TaxID=1720316 RepID=A0A845R1Z4_9CLOT|nr:amidohydrolase family protein [Senegalia massiliensis]NBI07736.1 N-acyl-D-amino-acid deacylase [Senegalia massiliensis]